MSSWFENCHLVRHTLVVPILPRGKGRTVPRLDHAGRRRWSKLNEWLHSQTG